MGWYRYGWIEKCTQEGLLSEITQTNLKLLVLALGFVYDKLVQNRLHSDWFGTLYIIANTFDTYYILAGMYGTYHTLASTYWTNYILSGTVGTHYILLGLYVYQRLYYSCWDTYFVMTVSNFMIACSNLIVCAFVYAK